VRARRGYYARSNALDQAPPQGASPSGANH